MKNHYCCVPECSSWVKRNPELSFHTFPKAGKTRVYVETSLGNRVLVDRRHMWIQKLKIQKEVTPHMNVCSLHFTEHDFFRRGKFERVKRRTLKLNAVPSKNLPTISPEPKPYFTTSPVKSYSTRAEIEFVDVNNLEDIEECETIDFVKSYADPSLRNFDINECGKKLKKKLRLNIPIT